VKAPEIIKALDSIGAALECDASVTGLIRASIMLGRLRNRVKYEGTELSSAPAPSEEDQLAERAASN
jgi:hypothetical protein